MRPIASFVTPFALVAMVLAGVIAQSQEPQLDVAPPGAFTLREITFPAINPAETAPPDTGPVTPSSDEPAPEEPEKPKPGGPGMGVPMMGRPGMGGPMMGGPGMGGPGYDAVWYPSSPVSHAAGKEDLGLIRQGLSAAAPVWRNGEDMLMLSARVRHSLFFTDAVLPDSHRAFPEELWNVSLGTNYMHKFANGWSGAVGINIGSASDKPFHSIDEMNLGFMSLLNVPARNERDAWRFMLMYSPVGNLNFPIPGVSYQWNPSERFQASIGLPFSLSWRPTDDLTIDVMYMPIVTVNARVTYKLAEQIFLYGGFESLQEAYLLADREKTNDRFMGFEKRLLAGIRWDLWQHAALDVSAGYAFDRYYGMGQNQIDGNLDDEVRLDPGAFLSAALQVRF